MIEVQSRIDRWRVEPFRLFFPLGILASTIGVLLWPAFFHSWINNYPLEAHARLMVFGFCGSFIVGFLGTAGPRLLGTPAWSRWELFFHLLLAVLLITSLAFQKVVAADFLIGVWLIGVMKSMLLRYFVGHPDVPPPGFFLAILGLGGAAVSGIVLSLGSRLELSFSIYQFVRLIYFQGLLWLPILGIAPYLLPRFFGRKSLHSFDESLRVPTGWMPRFVESIIAGLLLVFSFVIEVWIGGCFGMILRAAVVTTYLIRSVPGLISWGKGNGLVVAVRWTLPCALLGWLLAARFLPLRVGMLHLMFIGGVGLLIVCAATRVILGHHERHDRLGSSLKWFHAVWALMLITAATRLVADFIPKVRISHFTYAAILWIFIVGFWMCKIRIELKSPALEKED